MSEVTPSKAAQSIVQRGGSVSDLKRMKEMEDELSRLKRMYTDLALENQAMKDLIEKKL